MQNFQGKIAVITGAGRGIGKGIALKCAAEGMQVVLAGPNPDSVSAAEAELGKLGSETLVVKTDIENIYIGPRGFSAQHHGLQAWIQGRAENISTEKIRPIFNE